MKRETDIGIQWINFLFCSLAFALYVLRCCVSVGLFVLITYTLKHKRCTHCEAEPLTPQAPTNTHMHTHKHTRIHTPQTSRVLISLSLLLTVTVPLLRRVSGCVDWKQVTVTQHKVLSIETL